MPHSSPTSDHAAVVVGAGMARLLSASVLARRPGPVLVVDRDVTWCLDGHRLAARSPAHLLRPHLA